MVMLNSNKPIKAAHFKKLANQSMFYGALVIEMLLVKARKILVILESEKHSNRKNRDIWVI